jgi:hypothetical protein
MLGNFMNTQHSYTLAELAADFGLTERTARYYIEKVLPPHHRQGRGRVARYGQGTWNCFVFIRLLRKQYGFGPGQARGILRGISQPTVDRVVAGDEELAIMGVPVDAGAPGKYPLDSEPATPLRKAGHAGQTSPAAPAAGEAAPPAAGHAPEDAWQMLYSDGRLRIQSSGSLDLTHLQEEQVRVAAWLIREALE